MKTTEKHCTGRTIFAFLLLMGTKWPQWFCSFGFFFGLLVHPVHTHSDPSMAQPKTTSDTSHPISSWLWDRKTLQIPYQLTVIRKHVSLHHCLNPWDTFHPFILFDWFHVSVTIWGFKIDSAVLIFFFNKQGKLVNLCFNSVGLSFLQNDFEQCQRSGQAHSHARLGEGSPRCSTADRCEGRGSVSSLVSEPPGAVAAPIKGGRAPLRWHGGAGLARPSSRVSKPLFWQGCRGTNCIRDRLASGNRKCVVGLPGSTLFSSISTSVNTELANKRYYLQRGIAF